MKKMIHIFFIIVFVFQASFALAVSVENTSASSVSTNEMLHMIMTVKWGNVEGEVEDGTENIFDGSISFNTPTTTNANRVSLINELLFEKHNSERDKITSRKNPVSWTSLIYNHYDGVRVLLSGNASNEVVIDTTKGSVNKTLKELYDLDDKLVIDVGDGKEIVVETNVYRRRVFILNTIWGVVDAEDGNNYEKVDFTGNLSIDGGSDLRFLRTLQFETNQGDKITSNTPLRIDFDSFIYNGLDGIMARVLLDKNIDNNEDKITVNFTSDKVNYTKDFSLIDLYHNRVTKETITVGDTEYNLILSVKQFENRKLIKVFGKPAVYFLEDGLKKPILTADVFKSWNFKWEDIEEVSQDEADFYPTYKYVNFPDGTLAKAPGSPHIYWIANGKRNRIADLNVLAKLGARHQIRKITMAELSAYKEGLVLNENSDHPEGSLIRLRGTSKVYLVKGRKLMPVDSTDILKANNLKEEYILDVTAPQFKRFKIGDNLNYPDGTLIQGAGTKVYLLDKGQKRVISKNSLGKSRFKVNLIKKVKNTYLQNFTDGASVVAE